MIYKKKVKKKIILSILYRLKLIYLVHKYLWNTHHMTNIVYLKNEDKSDKVSTSMELMGWWEGIN